MEIDIVTKEDLRRMKTEMIAEIREILEEEVKKESSHQWLRTAEVRKMLGISPGTLQSLRINGTLPYRKIGGSMYYRRKDIERMMERGKQ